MNHHTMSKGPKRYIKIKNSFLLCTVMAETIQKKTCAINDPFGQTRCPASSDHYSHLKWKSETDVQTPHVQIVISSCRDCGSAEWINNKT